MRLGAIGAAGAGVLGLLSLVMTVTAPDLYGPESAGSLALRFNPGARDIVEPEHA